MNENYKEAAKQRGEKRSADVEQRVEEAIATITEEIKENAGIYPKNGGAVSMNEVARRAGIHITTFYTATQRELGQRVRIWVDSIKKKEVVGRMRVRRTFQERAEDWKAKYLDLQNSHIKTELDLQQAEAERDDAIAMLERLRQEKEALLEMLKEAGKRKVTPIANKKK